MGPLIIERGTFDLVKALEVGNLAFVGEVVARAALMRTESRGQHFRDDHPEKDDTDWLKWMVLHKGEGDVVWEKMPVPKIE